MGAVVVDLRFAYFPNAVPDGILDGLVPIGVDDGSRPVIVLDPGWISGSLPVSLAGKMEGIPGIHPPNPYGVGKQRHYSAYLLKPISFERLNYCRVKGNCSFVRQRGSIYL